jgi:hypothetical protein
MFLRSTEGQKRYSDLTFFLHTNPVDAPDLTVNYSVPKATRNPFYPDVPGTNGFPVPEIYQRETREENLYGPNFPVGQVFNIALYPEYHQNR